MLITQILVEKNVPCTMRDGTVLYADIYRPNHAGTYPVLLTRHPYNKDLPHYSHRYLDTNRLVTCGYVVIIQDVRGRFHSEGEFLPFAQEAEDGYDTVEWAAQLPYCSGKVGMFGLSYYGFTQLAAASLQPPHLFAMAPAMTLNDLRDGSFFRGGALQLGLLETWLLESIAPDLLQRQEDKSPQTIKKIHEMATALSELTTKYHSPLVDSWTFLNRLGIPESICTNLHRSLDSAEWERVSIKQKLKEIHIPALHIGGWYDCFIGPTLDNYMEMKKGDAAMEPNIQKLIIGPWGHGFFASTIGERSFGVHSSGDWINLKYDLTDLHRQWFDMWLKEITPSTEHETPVQLFIMGTNEWRQESEWPLSRTRYIPFYLHSKNGANSLNGDGTLSTVKPEREEPDTYVYDPANPVPTKGGATLFTGICTMGPQDQREIEGREDVLVYTSAPLSEELEVTGPVKALIWALSDADDTDFTAKLVDVFPDGTAYQLTEGVIRAKHQNGYVPTDSIAGKVILYEIDLWATSNVFLPDHSIRLEISSSNFPQYDANLNTGCKVTHLVKFKKAVQAVFHDEQHPSYVLLPVIPKLD